MAITPPAVQTYATPPPAQMSEIAWVLNTNTGYYDIQNSFTPDNNQGNLQVIQSKILITLGTIQGEWAADPSFGIPFNTLSANSDNPDVLSNVIVNEMLTVQNVNNVIVQNFTYIATTRSFIATYTVNTTFGITTVTVG